MKLKSSIFAQGFSQRTVIRVDLLLWFRRGSSSSKLLIYRILFWDNAKLCVCTAELRQQPLE